MTRMAHSLLAVALATGLAGYVAGQSPELNVKLGLWEMTMTVDMPAMDTSKMTPEQQAQIAAMMRGRAGMAAVVTKSCITKEKLADHKYAEDRPGQTCKRTVTKATPTTLDITQVCTGAMASTSDMHLEALSTTSIKITATQTSGRGGQAIATMTGKWVGADCGDIK